MGAFARLSGLQRLGIVLSIIWAVAAGFYTHNADVERAENFAKFAYKVCSNTKTLSRDRDLSSCDAERQRNLATWMEGNAGNAAFVALAPLPFGWLVAFILLYLGRIQIASL